MSDESAYRAAFKLVADFWVLRIIEELSRSDGPVRYSILQRGLDGISPATLSSRLKSLETQGLLERATDHHEGRGSSGVSYMLTGRGREAIPVLDSVIAFAKATS